MKSIPCSREAYQLLHEGSIALAEVEAAGIRVDEDHLARAEARIQRRIQRLQRNLQESEVAKTWRETYGHRTNFSSNDQLGRILFEVMGFACPNHTATGKFKTDEETLGTVDHPFVKDHLQIRKLEKSLSTYLRGIQREVVDGFIHPVFNLHIPRTYRSSSDSPNFQNIPTRDPEVAKLVRRAFLPRPGRCLAELDYSGIEVSIAACYHKDPTMLSYLKDKTKDMHRDAAMECFLLSLGEMTPDPSLGHEDKKRIKDIRYVGKNRFVFPQFYGDWYIDCARQLWDGIRTMDLRMRDGRPLVQHLRSQGIKELGDLNPAEKPKLSSFERHIQKVEAHWWGKRFPVYDQWRKDWVAQYQRQGWMKMLSGFVCSGLMKRNEIINYPVQGAAFHCLLWSLIRLMKRIREEKMKTLVVGQIHDSIVSDVPEEELKDFLQLAHEVMVDDLKAAWPWVIVPIEIEAEVTPVDQSWFDKREVKIAR